MNLLLLLLLGCPTNGSDDSPASLACGTSLTCTGQQVCVREDYVPECGTRADTGVDCPEGTTPSQCGGAGVPCCCGPLPDPTYQCYEPTGCDEAPTCDCVADACPADKMCSAVLDTTRQFACAERDQSR